MPNRNRAYNSNADRQRAYRNRQRTAGEAFEREFEAFQEALIRAFERGDSERVINHLPDDPAGWLRMVRERLQGYKLVAHEREEK